MVLAFHDPIVHHCCDRLIGTPTLCYVRPAIVGNVSTQRDKRAASACESKRIAVSQTPKSSNQVGCLFLRLFSNEVFSFSLAGRYQKSCVECTRVVSFPVHARASGGRSCSCALSIRLSPRSRAPMMDLQLSIGSQRNYCIFHCQRGQRNSIIA